MAGQCCARRGDGVSLPGYALEQGSVIKLLCTLMKGLRDNSRSGTPNHTLLGYSQVHPRGHQPITGPSVQAQSMDKQGHAMAGGTPSQGPLRTEHPVQASPGVVPADPQPRCPGMTPITMSHWEQLSRSPFGLRRLLPRAGTHYGVQGKSSLGLHRT